MKLVHQEIPVEFLRAMPEGLKLVTRHGREFLVVESAFSRRGTSLITESVRIHGEPSIRIGLRLGDQEGLIFVDAYWGSHAKLYGFLPEIGDREHVVEAYVPETKESLMIDRECDIEGCSCTRGIELVLPGGRNAIHVCARLGCPGHRLVLSEMPEPVSETLSGINFFGAGSLEDNWFDSV
ncbi:MAG: hypothetical protein WD492_13920 [Alkalispirochaeta sp.]